MIYEIIYRAFKVIVPKVTQLVLIALIKAERRAQMISAFLVSGFDSVSFALLGSTESTAFPEQIW